MMLKFDIWFRIKNSEELREHFWLGFMFTEILFSSDEKCEFPEQAFNIP